MAILRIPKLGVEVAVFDGTDELVLNRGVGRIIGSTRVGESGNIGIAGHRDGFFRVLKDIALGDLMTLSSPSATTTYSVDQIEIVTPDDVSVLAPRAGPSVTLVTCYPFYYSGDAPQRFIVHGIERAGTTEVRPGSGGLTNATDTELKGERNMDRDIIRRALSLGLATFTALGCIIAVGLAQQTASVERGEVLAVNGNDIMVKMDTGEVRHYTAPPGATANVDGKQITVTDLRPGMKLQRTTITTTTDRVVSSVRTTQGTVWQVNAPYVIFTGPDGKNKQVKVPDGTKFTIEGEEKTVFDLRKGMKFTATIVTQAPERVVSSTRSTTGTAPPPPEAGDRVTCRQRSKAQC